METKEILVSFMSDVVVRVPADLEGKALEKAIEQAWALMDGNECCANALITGWEPQ